MIRLRIPIRWPDGVRNASKPAVVVLRPGETATADEIIEYCKGRLAPYKVPRSVEFRTDLPKSTIGKVLRRVLRDEELAKAKG